MPRSLPENIGGKNVAAALDLIAWTEGTARSKYTKDDGYDILVGGIGDVPKTFSDYSKHPNLLITVNSKGLKSTAAGRYQALYGTWIECVKKYGFQGRFTPEAQDLFAVKKITERGAMDDLKAGRIESFIQKCNKEWASFFGSPYGQRTHTLEEMLAKFKEFGGTVA